jgi:hypothetical protein
MEKEKKEKALQAVSEAVNPVLEGLKDFASYGEGAIRLSRRRCTNLPFSVYILTDGSVSVQTNATVGKGKVKLFKAVFPLDSRVSCVVASPANKTPPGIRAFEFAVEKCAPIHEKLSGLPGFPICFSTSVQNVDSSLSPRGLILERFTCNLVHLFCEDLLPLTSSERECLQRTIIKNLVDAVALMHETNVVHLDLKVNNILFNLDGKVGVTDFDCAIDFDKPIPEEVLSGAKAFCPLEVIDYCKDIFRLPEAQQFEYFSREIYRKVLEKIDTHGQVKFLGEIFSSEDIGLKKVYPRLLKQLGRGYDVYGLALCMITILTCRSHKTYDWNNIANYRFQKFASPIEEGLMAIARGIVETRYTERPTMAEVKVQVAAILA